MVRILIADNCEVVRAGIRETLKSRPYCRVVAEADDGRRAISQAVTETPDIAIIELALPVADGIEVTARIRRRRLRTATLIFTLVENETLIRDALAAGARGCVFKSEPRQLLLDAVASLESGDLFLSHKAAEALSRLSVPHCPSRGRLTKRERSVLRLIVNGQTNRSIGVSLNIAVKTVETHRAGIMRKLNLSSLAALVRYAVRNHIVES
jgi:DNA-binding NarL/FixJ family response regulator